MKIIYIAKHDQRSGNDDEGAIAHAFRVLGHEVKCFRETQGTAALREKGDFILFHHWRSAQMYLRQKNISVVMWYFDLVDAKDVSSPEVLRRSQKRIKWMRETIPSVDIGFCTDGDWVANDQSGKLHWLMQGADERIVGRGQRLPTPVPPLIFPGMHQGNGKARERFIDELMGKYGGDFRRLGSTYREQLRDYIASCEIVMCPNAPVTQTYHSNRVYLCAGFGACVVHPYTNTIKQHFNMSEILMYSDLEVMYSLISKFRLCSDLRESMRENALERVKKQHLYRHRVEEMLSVMKQRGII